MTLQDFMDMCSRTAQWCSQAANDCAKQWSNDANQNIDILRRDLSNMYDNFEKVMTPRDLSCLNASELRQRTIEEIYHQVKSDIVICRDSARCLSSNRCTSLKILDEVKRMLESEGFEVAYEVQPSSTVLTIEW
jgi:histidyl-tRNA synthetase